MASVVYAALSLWMNVASRGFLEADGVTHYLYARFAFSTPAYFADVWARPVRVLLHAIPAQLFGLFGVRATSLACALAVAWLTFAIARRLGWRRPQLAGFFVLAQPLLFLHSFSELTELPFALLAAVAFLLLLDRRWPWFAIVCGAMPAARPEGVAFLLLAVVLLLLHRRARWLPLVALPILAWNTAGWILWGTNAGPWHRWLIDQFPYAAESLYAAGPWWRYLAVLPTVVSPLVVPAVLIGTVGTFRRAPGETSINTRVPLVGSLPDCWLIALIPWGILAVHSYLHARGRMSSSGEPRYLLSAAPYWALLAHRGWLLIADRFELRRPERWAVAIALLPIVIDLTYPVLPLRPQPDARLAERIAAWYETWPGRDAYPRLCATHPLIYYYTDEPPQDVTAAFVRNPPPGIVFIYDSMYASYNSNPERKVTPAMFEAAGWTELPTDFALKDQDWRAYVSPRSVPIATMRR